MKLFNKDFINKINLLGLSIYALLMPIMQNPYKPFLGNSFLLGKIQLVDIIFLFISPFVIIEFILDRKNIFAKYKLQIIGVLTYTLSILFSIKDSNALEGFIQLISAIYLSLLLLTFFIVIKTKKQFLFIGKSIIVGALISVIFSIIGLLLFYIFDYSWPFIIQENKVFPYLGEVARLTGTFKPTAKLLSSYLTLLIPSFISLSVISRDIYKYLFLFLTIVSLMIYPFTLSRGIVGLFFSLAFLFSYLKNSGFIEKIFFKFLSISFVLFFAITSILSTIHISDISTDYSFDGNLNHPKTVYFYFDPDKGMEKISTEISFAKDHYYWLKKSSLIVFNNNPFGVGIGNFSKSLKSLEKENIIPQGLSRHPTPQSEFLYAAAERGFLGVISIIILFFSWIFPLIKNRKNLLVFSALGSLISICFIDSIHLEITKFRFLWFFVGFIIVFAKDFRFDNEKKISNQN